MHSLHHFILLFLIATIFLVSSVFSAPVNTKDLSVPVGVPYVDVNTLRLAPAVSKITVRGLNSTTDAVTDGYFLPSPNRSFLVDILQSHLRDYLRFSHLQRDRGGQEASCQCQDLVRARKPRWFKVHHPRQLQGRTVGALWIEQQEHEV
jgi:hypothetical protein